MQVTNKKLFWPLFALLCIFLTYRIYKYQKVNFQNSLKIEQHSSRPKVDLEKIKASGIPVLDIKVKYKYLARLSTNFSSGKSEKPQLGIKENKKSYKAKIFFKGKKYKGKISFRGEGDWHRRFWKKSIKIKLKSDERLFGYRTLNLDNPKYVAPFLRVVQYETAKKMGILAPASFPVWVNLNGTPYGILQFWGRYDRDMLSESNHPEGDLYGEKDNYLSFEYLMSDKQNWKKYTSKLGKKDFKNMDNIERLMAINNLEGQKFKKAVYEFFDIDQMLAYHNHANLFSATRQNYHNVRVYFNPISLKYELVPNDLLGAVSDSSSQNIFIAFNKLWKKILSLPDLRRQKHEQLDYFINDYKIFNFIQERFAFWDKIISPIISMDQVSSYGLKNNYNSNFPNIEDQYKYQVEKWDSFISQRKEYLEKALQ